MTSPHYMKPGHTMDKARDLGLLIWGYFTHQDMAIRENAGHWCMWNTYSERVRFRWGPHFPFNEATTATLVVPIQGCLKYICRICGEPYPACSCGKRNWQ